MGRSSRTRARARKVAAGGERIGSTGNYFAPTVLDEVPLDAMVFNQEPFGPVAAIRGFDQLDEAITEANRLPYGLAGYAYTRSLATADQLTQRVEVGMLWINQPALPWPKCLSAASRIRATAPKAAARRWRPT